MGIEEELCPLAGSCEESDHGGREECLDYKACPKYRASNKGRIIIETLPSGIRTSEPEDYQEHLPKAESILEGFAIKTKP
jgi:hypothetical protein